VFYRGFREGKGIWGTWEISVIGHGGFHIWPLAAGEGEHNVEKKETEQEKAVEVVMGGYIPNPKLQIPNPKKIPN
jgi:hypothetical protein